MSDDVGSFLRQKPGATVKQDDAIFDEMALQVAEMMTAMFMRFPGKEHMLANILCDSLGGFIAVASKEPAVAIERISTRLKGYDWKTVRAEHYMAVNGIKSQETGRVLNFGASREKPG